VHDLLRGTTISTGLAGRDDEADRDKIILHADETAQGVDLNGDGDALDREVLHIIDLRRRSMTNLERVLARDGTYLLPGHRTGSPLVGFTVNEVADGRDHDGDGMLAGSVMHVYHMQLGGPFSLGVPGYVNEAPMVLGETMLFESHERPGEDWNADGDSDDDVAMVLRRVR